MKAAVGKGSKPPNPFAPSKKNVRSVGSGLSHPNGFFGVYKAVFCLKKDFSG